LENLSRIEFDEETEIDDRIYKIVESFNIYDKHFPDNEEKIEKSLMDKLKEKLTGLSMKKLNSPGNDYIVLFENVIPDISESHQKRLLMEFSNYCEDIWDWKG